MRNKLLVTDVDQVLLDWHEGFLEWVELNHGWKINPNHPQDSYDMVPWFLPLEFNGEELHMNESGLVWLIEEFNSYPRCLQPIDKDIESHLEDLRDYGIEIVALTSFGGCPKTGNFREEYLKVIFGDVFKEVIILPLRACKKAKLKELQPDWFVEDNTSHSHSGLELGIKTFILDYSYNKDSRAIRVRDWEEIYHLIVEDR